MSLLNGQKIIKVDKTINLNKEIIDSIEQFVEQIDTKHYNQRNQTNEKKKKKDQWAGKLFEWAAFSYLKEAGHECSAPDMQIYSSKKKSFAPDMEIDGVPVHCKSCHADSKYPVSWVFQKSDSNWLSGKDKEFYDKTKSGIVITGVVDHKEKSVKILWLIDKNYAIDLLEPPKVRQLMNIKECVYNDRLEKEYHE